MKMIVLYNNVEDVVGDEGVGTVLCRMCGSDHDF